ncbi:pentapeptide repeat-containing protein [Nocardioides speluncae]|uniref:pentapeptide repeat-containing protein n=1 Tax=Nocardioides speluncae TaxID=2670337 RepID=UPI000D68C90E|nr:pentapeptide repeat-containing protein [Nocardioides speluncae]
MKTRTIGQTKLVVPDLDPRDLDAVAEPPTGDVLEVTASGADWSRLRLENSRIRASTFSDVNLAEAEWHGVRLTGCRLERVDFSSARLSDVVIERCEFIDCRMTGLHLSDTSWTNVIFERCALDYAVLDAVRTTGPVAWSDCNLTEATFMSSRLNTATVINSNLRRLHLEDCDLSGTDLRHNEIREVVGLASLRGTRLSIDQLPSLADLTARELGIDLAQ